MNDLFECPELLPESIKAILNRYNDLEIEKGVQYADLIKMGKELAIYGYQFDFYLDCIPYNLQKIKN
jgi:inorganic pyrophosphatase